jgi:hypothetical protein
LDLREIADPEICCGSAGIYNILNPEPARELGNRKAANIVATGASLLVTANPGCLMQVAGGLERAGSRMAMAHTVEVLDASIRGLPASALTPDAAAGSTRNSGSDGAPAGPVVDADPERWVAIRILGGPLRRVRRRRRGSSDRSGPAAPG